MAKITVELVKYDMDKTKKRKRKDFLVSDKSEEAVIEKLEKIHKGEKVQAIHEIVWGEPELVEAQEHDQDEEAEVFTGMVKFYDDVKGFGFIKPDADMDDLFFHASALNGEHISDEDIVEFEIGSGKQGEIAIRIQLLD
jgi:CspA family cold shock protein